MKNFIQLIKKNSEQILSAFHFISTKFYLMSEGNKFD